MTNLDAHDIEPVDVVVIGGGLAGLTAAVTAAAATADTGHRVLVLESHRLGGRAAVDRRAGFLFNRGPRALYVDGPGRAVLTRLGVSTDHGASPPLRRAMAMNRDGLDLIPQGVVSLLRTSLLPTSEKLSFMRSFLGLARLDVSRFEGMSADEAVEVVASGPATAELLRAMVRLSTYTAATDVLDGAAALRQVQLGAGAGAIYLDGGWQTIVDGLERVALERGVEIHRGQAVRELVDEGRTTLVRLADGGRIRAGQVVIAVGNPDAAASLLGGRPASWAAVGPPAPVACLELGLRRAPTTHIVLGIDQPTYLSLHSPPADLAPDGGAVVHLMRYLRHDETLDSTSVREELWNLARSAGVADGDVVEERFLARMVAASAIPTGGSGGLAGRVPVEVPGRPGVLLAGDWVGAEGMLADASLASGSLAGRLVAERSGSLAGV